MAQSLKCTHCGAVMKSATPIAAGKKVKCPKCSQAFTVEAEPDENPFATGDSGSASGATAGPASGDAKEPPKKGKGMMIGLIVGGVLLLCCCCPGMGGGGWWVFSSFFGKPDFYGVWQTEDFPPNILGFDTGGKGYYHDVLELAKSGKTEPPKDSNMTWKQIDAKTVELKMNDSNKKLFTKDSSSTFTYSISGDTLTLVATTGGKATYKLKKVADKK